MLELQKYERFFKGRGGYVTTISFTQTIRLKISRTKFEDRLNMTLWVKDPLQTATRISSIKQFN